MYERFKALDGRHPWRSVCPDGYVDYRARYRAGGHVIYFNYALAKELGLIGREHPSRMDERLERAILSTFAIQIINEYDQACGNGFSPEEVRPHPYMATRYLQAQHKDKRGLRSGDGRAVWNGLLKTRSLTFDVSSRGTGATCLSPGAQIAGKPVKTGDNTWGYCDGTAELDEMLGTAMMSEIFYQSGLPTERTLAVIDFGDSTCIGVRTAPNLIRPAHIFRYLKQGRCNELRASLDYLVARQVKNRFWDLQRDPKLRYRKALSYIAESYGKLVAVLEEEYIFNWLAWDGDNMLAHGAILDYGSIRQFAAKHDKYRYDDVDRFSSSLTEQRFWARELVKAFAQAFDFALSGRKKTLDRFKNARALREFDRAFERERDARLLWRLGFTPEQVGRLQRRAGREIRDFRRAMAFFEDQKVSRGIEKTNDGITHRPVFLIRNMLRTLPAYLLFARDGQRGAIMPPDMFCKIMAASYVSRRDRQLTASRMARARNFQMCYQRLLAAAGKFHDVLRVVQLRSAVINHPQRMTGDAMIWVVDAVIRAKDKLDADELQSVIDRFIESQVLVPGRWKPFQSVEIDSDLPKAKLMRAIQETLEEHKEAV
jgi:uncharacterized protein YdiU (UPF0061 family)